MDDLTTTSDTTLVPEGWRPTTIRDFEFVLERIGETDAAVAAIREQEAAAIAAIKARADELVAKEERAVAYLRALTLQAADAIKSDLLIGKKKSRDFLAGRIGWRKKGGKLTVTNKEELVAWLTAQDDTTLYRLTVAPEMKALQALTAATGVIPPGCEFESERDEPYLEANPLPTLTAPSPKEMKP